MLVSPGPGYAPILVQNDGLFSFLDVNALPQLQYEAVGILASFSSMEPESIPFLVKRGIVPALAQFLHSPYENNDDNNHIRELAFYTMGNIAATSQEVCELVVHQHGVLQPLLTFIQSYNIRHVQVATKVLCHFSGAIVQSRMMVNQVVDVLQQILSMKDNAIAQDEDILIHTTLALSIIGTSNQVLLTNATALKLVEMLSHKSLLVVSSALKAVAKFAVNDTIKAQADQVFVVVHQQHLHSDDDDVLAAACEALVAFDDAATHFILTTPGVGTALINLLCRNPTLVASAALEVLANLAKGNENLIQLMMDNNGLPMILRLIVLGDVSSNPSLKNRAVTVASRILGNGSPSQIQEAVCSGLLYAVLDVLDSLPLEAKKEVARAILWIISHATLNILKIVEVGCTTELDVLRGESKSLKSKELDKICKQACGAFEQRYLEASKAWELLFANYAFD